MNTNGPNLGELGPLLRISCFTEALITPIQERLRSVTQIRLVLSLLLERLQAGLAPPFFSAVASLYSRIRMAA
ncbi:MAG: hypothetical protein M2R45_04477 [Verrucomicrobia subdivision 3 bacterium]|nr:hypothetical protein [Limisphaerales bacterium]